MCVCDILSQKACILLVRTFEGEVSVARLRFRVQVSVGLRGLDSWVRVSWVM